MRALQSVIAIAVASACADRAADTPDAAVAIDAFPDARDLGHIELHVPGQPGKPRVLVYTFENFWRHASNLDCRGQVVNMNTTRGFDVSTTNDPVAINAHNLASIDVIVLCITSGSGITELGKQELEAWIKKGGGIVGFHSGGTMTEHDWPFFVNHIGTRFAGHVNGIFNANVKVLSNTHPITAGITNFTLDDEWYMFTQRPETIPGAQMLLELDEDSLPADYPAMYKQGFHAIGWAREVNGGRVFYSAFGHMPTAWYDPTVLEITGRAIEWAAHKR